ncbi:MAG: hypothetical protein AAGF46_02350 [Pseudomonadota bacterium]
MKNSMNKLQRYSRELRLAAKREEQLHWRGQQVQALSEVWDEQNELFGSDEGDSWVPPTQDAA